MSSATRTAQDERAQARLAEQNAKARQARQARLGAAGGLLLVGAAAVALVVAQNGPDEEAAPVGAPFTTPPPWPAQARGLYERVASLGFPPVGDESYHAHALLTVYRDGQQVPVPADLGFDERGAHTSLHTRTPTASFTWKPTTPARTPSRTS